MKATLLLCFSFFSLISFIFVGHERESLLPLLSFTSNTEPTLTNPATQPVELGKVQWYRDFDTALAKAKKMQKPIFLLFQEVPGCGTCQRYGKNVLSHPLIVEAIEDYFVPVVIYNNKGGADAEVLKYYKEPSWNNPVVRIVNSEKKNLIPRVSGNYSELAVVQAMLQALDIQNIVAPKYLELLSQELSAQTTGTETATFSMYCFWKGESKLGQLNGVVATQPGFMNGKEVVQVEYNPLVTSYEKLLEQSKNQGIADAVFTHDATQSACAKKEYSPQAVKEAATFRPDKEPKYYLTHSIYRHVPMTALQAARANSLLAQKQSPNEVLSPRQIKLAAYIQQHSNTAWKNMVGEEFLKNWWAIVEKYNV